MVSSQRLQHHQQIILYPKWFLFLQRIDQINVYKAKSKDFYNFLNVKIHTEDQTGHKRWSEKLSSKKDVWTRTFKSLKNICKETKLKEF